MAQETGTMNVTGDGAAKTWLILGFVWVVLCAFDFYTTPGKGGYSLTNHRFDAGLIALASAIASFVAFWNARRNRA